VGPEPGTERYFDAPEFPAGKAAQVYTINLVNLASYFIVNVSFISSVSSNHCVHKSLYTGQYLSMYCIICQLERKVPSLC